MWGRGANPVSYPSGYGYVPSKVISLVVDDDSQGPAKMLVSAYLMPKGNVASVPAGGTVQYVGYGVYSDGSSGTLPDEYGNAVNWNTSDHRVAKVSTHGHVTALAPGSVTVEGLVGDVEATSVRLAVTPGKSAEQ
jgi:Bacterial Ig-like domain (group 2)